MARMQLWACGRCQRKKRVAPAQFFEDGKPNCCGYEMVVVKRVRK